MSYPRTLVPLTFNVWSYPHGLCTDFSAQPVIGCVGLRGIISLPPLQEADTFEG